MESIRQFDLLPSEFRDEVEASRVRGFWILSFSLLCIGLGHLLMTDLFRHETDRRFQTMLQAKVAPILQVRDEARRQLANQSTRLRWIEQVETARPDDCLLQTLAAVSLAVAPDADQVLVDSIEISLATELPVSLPSPTNTLDTQQQDVVTVPAMVINGRSGSDAVANLISRLNAQPRVEKMTVEPNSNEDGTLFQVIGVPRITRVLP